MENIPEVVKNTAKNMYELLMQLAAHIEKLEAENAEMRSKLDGYKDDFK